MPSPQALEFADFRIEETAPYGLCVVATIDGRLRYFCIEGRRLIELGDQIDQARTRRLRAAWQ